MKKIQFLAGYFLVTCTCLVGQPIKVPFTSDRWNVQGAETLIDTFMGKESLLLKSGNISIKDLEFRDGIIETDMSFPQMRAFPGLAFRVQDQKNFEIFYVRPHQSGNPDATQYTPVFNGQAGWQLYHGEGYSQAFTYKFNTWHHLKLDIHGLQAEIYIDDMEKPLIKVAELKQEWRSGTIQLISEGIPTHFANFQYTLRQGAAPVAMAVPANGSEGVATAWDVSNVVKRDVFEKKYRLTPEIKKMFTWTSQRTEPSGTINLAKFGKWSDSANTIVCKLVIESVSEQLKSLSFGFSDYVTVYLNDHALYLGSDKFLSRDYRFLGTIGYFDSLILPLKKGSNELWFVLSEDFGGWGLKARFENMEGISLK